MICHICGRETERIPSQPTCTCYEEWCITEKALLRIHEYSRDDDGFQTVFHIADEAIGEANALRLAATARPQPPKETK